MSVKLQVESRNVSVFSRTQNVKFGVEELESDHFLKLRGLYMLRIVFNLELSLNYRAPVPSFKVYMYATSGQVSSLDGERPWKKHYDQKDSAYHAL